MLGGGGAPPPERPKNVVCPAQRISHFLLYNLNNGLLCALYPAELIALIALFCSMNIML